MRIPEPNEPDTPTPVPEPTPTQRAFVAAQDRVRRAMDELQAAQAALMLAYTRLRDAQDDGR